MAYGLLYRIEFQSRVYKHSWVIDILQDNYSGASSYLSLGASPVLRRDSSKSIQGTSLMLSLTSETVEQLISLYTTDNKQYKVTASKGGALIWSGFVLPEIYSEEYINAPYNVDVTASDGVGVLKDVPFELTGEVTILQVFKYCLDQTSLPLSFHLICDLQAEIQDINYPVWAQAKINVLGYKLASMSCYDVLAEVLSSSNSYVTQKNGAWLIARYTDKTDPYIYDNTLSYVGRGVRNEVVLGTNDSEAFPVGSLRLDILPAYKSCSFTREYHKIPSFCLNPSFSGGLTSWDVINQVSHITVNGVEYAELKNQTHNYASLSQRVIVTQSSATFELFYDFVCAALSPAALNTQGTFYVVVTLLQVGTGNYYTLDTDGWKLNQAKQLRVDSLLMGYTSPATTNSIIFGGFPVAGTLKIEFFLGTYAAEWSPENFALLVKNVNMTMSVSKGLLIEASLAPKASQSADDVKIGFADAPFSDNVERVLYNIIKIGSALTANWKVGTGAYASFLTNLVRDYCSIFGYAKRQLSGTIQSENLLETFFYDIFSDTSFYAVEQEYALYEDESGITLVEQLDHNHSLVIGAAQDIPDESQSSGGGSSGSGGGGGTTGLALGETELTAYRGDRGKVAYDHSQNSGVHITTTQKNSVVAIIEGQFYQISSIISTGLLLQTDISYSYDVGYINIILKGSVHNNLPLEFRAQVYNSGSGIINDTIHAVAFGAPLDVYIMSLSGVVCVWIVGDGIYISDVNNIQATITYNRVQRNRINLMYDTYPTGGAGTKRFKDYNYKRLDPPNMTDYYTKNEVNSGFAPKNGSALNNFTAKDLTADKVSTPVLILNGFQITIE